MYSPGRASSRQRKWLRISWATLCLGITISLSISWAWLESAEGQDRQAFQDSAGGVAESLTTALHRNADMADSVGSLAATTPRMTNRQFQEWLGRVGDVRRAGTRPIGFIRYVPGDQVDAYLASHGGDAGLDGAQHGPLQILPPGNRPFYCFADLGVWKLAEVPFPPGLDFCALQPSLVADAASGTTAVSPAMTPASLAGLGKMLGVEITTVPPELEHAYFYSTPQYSNEASSPHTRSNLVGWVGGFFDPRDLLEASVPSEAHLNVGLVHVTKTGKATTVVPAGSRWGSSFHGKFSVALDGTWLVDISGDGAHGALSPWNQAGLIALATVIANLLLFALLRVLASAESKALHQVSIRTAELRGANADRAQLLKGTLEVAERERTRLAAELHDGPIQKLAATGYVVDRAIRRLRRDDAETTATLLDQVRSDISEDTTALRTMMIELRPPLLDEAGIVSAVRSYAEAFAARTAITTDVVDRLEGLPPAAELEMTMYRVVQEALANVDRHAAATHVRVEILSTKTAIKLIIADDGQGFETSNAIEMLRHGHYGLAGMRERVEVAGGTWSIESTQGTGTTITASLPRAATSHDSTSEPSLVAP